jgi:hypothetical protein
MLRRKITSFLLVLDIAMSSLNTGDIFCMDILFELFEYFYVDELFKSFNNIIHHFPSLLKKGHVQLHIRHIDAHFRKHILPYIDINNVISIRIQNMYQMAPVNLGQFSEVRLLVLHNVTELNWPTNFPKKLKYLTIYVRSKATQEIFKKALSLDNIERLEFNSTFLHFHDCSDKLEKPSTIRHLVFNSQRCFIDYQFLLNNMPYLQSLRSTNTYYPHRSKINSGSFTYLHTVDLVCKHIDIDAMIVLLTNIAIHSLRRCRLININNSLSTDIANVLISCYFPDFCNPS